MLHSGKVRGKGVDGRVLVMRVPELSLNRNERSEPDGRAKAFFDR
jgi:hypothetical protein